MIGFWAGRKISGEPRIVTDDLLQEGAEPGMRWNDVLVSFMRVLSVAWLVKGLIAWGTIVGIGAPPNAFEDATIGYQSGMIYFAVIDLVAAVGLWLATTWGGVLWLLAVTSHLILAVFFPRFVANSTFLVSLFIIAIMMYLIVSWLAAIEE